MQQTASATPSRQERRVRRTRAMILAGFIQLMQQDGDFVTGCFGYFIDSCDFPL